MAQPPTSPAPHVDSTSGQGGFTLLEVVCVLALLAVLAGVILPAIPRSTSRTKLESFAMAAASLLKADRNAALRQRRDVATLINAQSRLIRSGSSSRSLQIPDDVVVEAVLSAKCNRPALGSSITFFPSGTSCGGVIDLSRAAVGYQIRVNWMTGGIDIVPIKRS